jgi:hypothetical protein
MLHRAYSFIAPTEYIFTAKLNIILSLGRQRNFSWTRKLIFVNFLIEPNYKCGGPGSRVK